MKLLELYWFLFLLVIGNVYGYAAIPQNYRDFLMVQLDKKPRSFDDIINIPKGLEFVSYCRKHPLETVVVPGSADVKHVILRIGRNSKSWENLGFGVHDFSRDEDEDPVVRSRQNPYKTIEEGILSVDNTENIK